MGTPKLKILQLSPQFPFPADDGGKIGISLIYKSFAERGFDVDFICFSSTKIHKAYIEEAEKYGNVYIIEHSTRNTPKRILLSLLNNTTSLYVHKHINKDIQKKLKEIIKDKHYDFIHADHTAMCMLGLYAKSLLNAPLGLRAHNVEHKIWMRYANNIKNNILKKMYVNHQANLLKKDEMFLFPKADICFTITDVDKKDALKIAPKGNYVTVSGGVYPDEWKIDSSIKRNPFEIIIATVYSWVHNVDGVVWFIENVLPKLREYNPKITLKLLGKNPPQFLQKYSNNGVIIKGYVPKVQPYLNAASIYIAPLFVGSGIRIKILEAMAIGLPVIATSISSEGINGTDSDGLFIRDKADDWVEIILKLINDNEYTNTLRQKASDFINNNFSWEKNINKMIDTYLDYHQKQK